MKKPLLIAVLALATAASAQDLVSKKGEQFLPEKDDLGIGVDATPFLQYAGNFFGKTSTNTAPGFNFLQSSQQITIRYFTDAKMAIRGGIRFGVVSQTLKQNANVRPASTSTMNPYPNPKPVVENKWKQSETNIALTGGVEMRRGKTRLQGYYGGELGIGYSSSRDRFTYGNSLNTSTTSPVDVDASDEFTGANNVEMSAIPEVAGTTSLRVLDRKNGAVFAFGLRGFIGAEYFILPKMSIGGEFGWGISFATGGKSLTTYESIGNNDPFNPQSNDQIGTTEVERPGGRFFFFDTENNNTLFGPAATLRMNLYF
jgi:hypothetical protein